MTIAIVKNGVFLHTKPSTEVILQSENNTLDRNYRLDEPKDVLKAAGIYGFISARNEATATQKAQGTTFQVGDGVVTETYLYVEKTPEEIKTETNSKLDAQIDALERQQLLPRITRDMHKMVTLQAAAGMGLTEANILDENHAAYSPGYARFYEFDAAIALLRASRV